jgi:hypothetical protein
LGNPVSVTPFLKQFTSAIAESFIVTYDAVGSKLVEVNFSTKLPKTKVSAAKMVLPGTRLAAN